VNIFQYISFYLMIGVTFNALYDLVISYIKNEGLRFNMKERIVFTLIWPIYLALLLFNYIKNIINGSNN